jgi:hypothetical protein
MRRAGSHSFTNAIAKQTHVENAEAPRFASRTLSFPAKPVLAARQKEIAKRKSENRLRVNHLLFK